MSKHEIVYMSEGGCDAAIVRGLKGAGLDVFQTSKITETLAALKNGHKESPLLIGDVQAGAIAMITLLREHGVALPTTVLFDRAGDNIHTPIQALQLGVRDYLLASDPETQRETRMRVLAEQVLGAAGKPGAQSVPGFEWDPVSHTIQTASEYIRLSPIEGRIFNMLLQHRGSTVPLEELIARALLKPSMDVTEGVKLLRPHMVRLRNKFDDYPELAHRIVNMRGTGYMLV
jgi:DNA-binding response OmpR family regulator